MLRRASLPAFCALAAFLCLGFDPGAAFAQGEGPGGETLPYVPVITPNGTTLPWKVVDGAKEYHLVAEVIRWEFAPGMVTTCWGFNGSTPGPTIEAVEGDRVRILVTNNLPEPTAVHWHGVILPAGMDGVQGLTQKPIPPGRTFKYEFTLKQHGTQMYHSHGDEMTQMGMGAMGFFIIHPKAPEEPKVERDFAIFLNEWFIEPGAYVPDPNVMTEFNIFTFNGRVYPGTAPLVVRTGQRVRVRIANVGQDFHPIHIHGLAFVQTGTDGGPTPLSAQVPETTVTVGPGQTRDIEFVPTEPGDWAMHCHRRHHPMNAMGHSTPNILGMKQGDLEARIRKLLPDYMAMGEKGMGDMAEMNMQGPENTLPMMGGQGPFGSVGMGGMFTVLKVRDGITSYEDPGFYRHPPGTVAEDVELGTEVPTPSSYVCPMHPEVVQDLPGDCPKCGMHLVPKK